MPITCSPHELRSHPVFQRLSDAELEFLGSKSQRVEAPARMELLATELMSGPSLFTLRTGWAMAYLPLPDGTRQILDFAIPGDLLGLGPLLLGRTDRAVRTITRASLCMVPGRSVLDVITARPDPSTALMRQLATDRARAGRRLALVARRRVAQRVGYLMLELMQRLTARGLADDGICPFPLHRRHFGDALSISRNHVKRSLELLRASGLASLSARTLKVHDIGRLTEFVDMPVPDYGEG